VNRGRSEVRAVADANLVAHFLLGTQPFVDEARHFRQAVGEAMARRRGRRNWLTLCS
jgi:hypothetical protein